MFNSNNVYDYGYGESYVGDDPKISTKLVILDGSVELNEQRGVFARTQNDDVVFITDTNEVYPVPYQVLETLTRIASIAL